MQTWVALFRGINVGGKNIMPMAKLRTVLESLKCQRVRTYIQSGNVVFDSASKSKTSLHKRILKAVESEFGFRPQLLLLTDDELVYSKAANPFPKAVAAPKTLHFFFLNSVPKQPDLRALNDLATETESFELKDRVFYLHAPDGFGKSKLAASVERKLGVAATARNYATVEKLSRMTVDV